MISKHIVMLLNVLLASYAGTGFALNIDENEVISGYSQTPTAVIPATQLSNLEIRLPHGNPYDQERPISLDGFNFVINRVNNINIDTLEHYELAKKYTVQDARKQGYVQIDQKLSNETGEIQFGGLEPGLYLVDILVPEDRIARINIPPMLILLPVTNSDGSWNSDVKINAKPEYLTPPPVVPPQPPVAPPPPPKIPNRLVLTGASVSGLIATSGLLVAGGLALSKRRSNRP